MCEGKLSLKRRLFSLLTAAMFIASYLLLPIRGNAAGHSSPVVRAGFRESDQRIYYFTSKPELNELYAAFPKTLTVTRQDGSSTKEKVTWDCTEDYESSALYMEVFFPIFNSGEDVQIDEKDLPYITVYLESQADGRSAGGTGNKDRSRITDGEEDQVQSGRYYASSSAVSNEERVFEFLRSSLGLNTAGAVGILTNIGAESSFNPNASGDNGTSYGICQWHASRFDSLRNWCTSNGYDYTSLDGQLQYLKHDAESNYPDTLHYCRNVEDSSEGAYWAAYQWCKWYEVPANTDATSAARGNVARDQYYPRYKDWSSDNNNSNGGDNNGGNGSNVDNTDSSGSDVMQDNDVEYPENGTSVEQDGLTISRDNNGDVRVSDSGGNALMNQFVSDGRYTYYIQADGTAMRDRLTYHPDGSHVIYFDHYGHEVFSNFHQVRYGAAGDYMGEDAYCYFNVYGYMYVNTVTYDASGTKLYYANPYGLLERGTWFMYGDESNGYNAGYGDSGQQWNLVATHRGYANSDMTLMKDQYTYYNGELVYMQGNGEAAN